MDPSGHRHRHHRHHPSWKSKATVPLYLGVGQEACLASLLPLILVSVLSQ